MDKFVIEKYIEISISTDMVYVDPDPHSYSVTIQKNVIGSTLIYLEQRTLPKC